jgi:hypothetical protein
MDPRAFHEVAKELVRVGKPAYCRTAIGRAYYGAFNVGAATLRDNGFTIGRGPQGHGDVVKHLLGADDPLVRRVGSQIDDLRAMRNKSDYRMDATDVENARTAAALVAEAERLIATLTTAFSSPSRASLVASIQNWKRAAGVP